MPKPLTPEEEAWVLEEIYPDPAACQGAISRQFDVLQGRTQMVLTLATLTLTITGFSGPKIAASSPVSRYCMVVGLACTILSLLGTLLGTLRIRWLTQIGGGSPHEMAVRMIAYRNRKTRLFRIELTLLGAGLAFYVSSVIAYLLTGE